MLAKSTDGAAENGIPSTELLVLIARHELQYAQYRFVTAV